MTTTILKYILQIEDEQSINMPSGARILRTGVDTKGNLCVWALVDTELELEKRWFYISGTGQPINPNMVEKMRFLGSAVMTNFVWHVFHS